VGFLQGLPDFLISPTNTGSEKKDITQTHNYFKPGAIIFFFF
jgi:hypothetical protein